MTIDIFSLDRTGSICGTTEKTEEERKQEIIMLS